MKLLRPLILLCITCFTALAPATLSGNSASFCIVTPKVASSYQYLFEEIISGIDSQIKNYRHIIFDPKLKGKSSKDLKNCQESTYILLGKRSIDFAKSANAGRVVIGAIKKRAPTTFPQQTTLPYQISPVLFLETLKKLSSTIETIHLIQGQSTLNKDDPDGLLAQADTLGLKIVIHTAPDYKKRAKIYQKVVKTLNPRKEALWIQDKGKRFNPILQWILKESWDRKIITLSNNLGHVKRGVLFTLYPDNHEYGRSLANAAITLSEGGSVDDSSLNSNSSGGSNFMTSSKLALNKIALRHIFGPEFKPEVLNPDLLLPYSD